MDLTKLIDGNRLYQHIYNLQGIRHSIISPEALVAAADYIKSEFEKTGITVIEERFSIEGFDIDFRNIVGVLDLSNGTRDEVIVSGHYDTVFNAPGANDNGTACAAVLEIARVISKNRDRLSGNFRFVTFDLEEENPAFRKYFWELGTKYNIHNREVFTKLKYKKNYNELLLYIMQSSRREDLEKLRKKLNELTLDINEQNFYNTLIEYLEQLFKDGEWVGVSALMGSSHYAARAKSEGRKIKGLINLDTIGYTSKKRYSQTYPAGIPLKLLKLIIKPIVRSIPFFSRNFKAVGVKDVTVGDFAALLVDKYSVKEADYFLQAAMLMDLKATSMYTGMSYNEIQEKMKDLLRSDHAPFWREHIPAIFISDSANFRYPYYHTGADTIDHLDFTHIKKVTQAALLTLIVMS